MKYIRVDQHTTPVHSKEEMEKNFIKVLQEHYGHLFTRCSYCGWMKHTTYVCKCGVDVCYLFDENGQPVKEKGNFVRVYEAPEKNDV